MTEVIAGPFCSTMLADMGAELAKIERAHVGDDTRHMGRYKDRGPEDQDYFFANNRTRRSIALDLKQKAHQEIAQALACEADVFVENYAPGKVGVLGLGWDELHALNPKLVYCSISGFGQTGPNSGRPALDPIVQAASGLMSVTGVPDGEPMQIGAPVADAISGMYAAYAIVNAIRVAERDGEGQHIDISMQDAMIAALGPRMGQTLNAHEQPPRVGNANPLRAPSDIYQASDGEYVSIICHNDGFWAGICRALGKPEWEADESLRKIAQRTARRDEVNNMVREVIATGPADEWIEKLDAERVPVSKVYDYAGAHADRQVVHRGLIRDFDHSKSGHIRIIGPPWISTMAEPEFTAPPLLGQHTADVLVDWLGWDADKAEAFADEVGAETP
ncbi:MAG TPA: formyl-CoA transferase [Rhodospirillaceae bacterium]|nr:formyl-CoA transferase [Rhodospirillaceae bacterium]